MNLPVQGSTDPKDDTNNKEDISPIREIILERRECLHDFQEIDDSLLVCRNCGEAQSINNLKPNWDDPNSIILINIASLPESFSNLAIRFHDLPTYVQSHVRRYYGKNFSHTTRSGG